MTQGNMATPANRFATQKRHRRAIDSDSGTEQRGSFGTANPPPGEDCGVCTRCADKGTERRGGLLIDEMEGLADWIS